MADTELVIPSIDYTNRDFADIFNQARSLIPFFTPEWTNHNNSDLGIVLLKQFSAIADVLHFYIDRRALEGFLGPAVSRQSVIELLKLIDYEPLSASAATSDLKFSVAAVLAEDLTIPAGTQVSTSASQGEEVQIFETLTEGVIPAGDLDVVVGARHGQTLSEDLDDSTGASFQERTLSSNSIIRDTVVIYVNETGTEEEWSEVDSLHDSTATDKVFEVFRNSNDTLSVRFGDNGQGKIPVIGAEIRASYVEGGGTAGNVGADKINSLTSTILYDGNPITLTVTNEIAASGGEEEMSIEEAKILGPKSVKTLERAVTLEDIETLALQVSGVSKVKAVIDNRVGRSMIVYVAPGGGGQPSNALLTLVEDYFDDKRMAGTTIIARPPVYVDVDITATIYYQPEYKPDDIESRVNIAIDDFFSLDNALTTFGRGAFASDVYALIDNLSGVEYVDIDRLAVNSMSTISQNTWSGDAEFQYIQTGSATADETWTVTFLTPTTYSISGTVSGIQSNIGTINTEYSSDGNQITIRINNLGNPMFALDGAAFRTTKVVGNSSVLENEIRQRGLISFTYEVVE
jgi:hypothetical protein